MSREWRCESRRLSKHLQLSLTLTRPHSSAGFRRRRHNTTKIALDVDNRSQSDQRAVRPSSRRGLTLTQTNEMRLPKIQSDCRPLFTGEDWNRRRAAPCEHSKTSSANGVSPSVGASALGSSTGDASLAACSMAASRQTSDAALLPGRLRDRILRVSASNDKWHCRCRYAAAGPAQRPRRSRRCSPPRPGARLRRAWPARCLRR